MKRVASVKGVVIIAVFLLTCLNMAFVHAATEDLEKSPEAVATEFYSWYVKTIVGHEDPMTDHPAELSAYVSQPLIAEVRRAMAREGGRTGRGLLPASPGLSRRLACEHKGNEIKNSGKYRHA